MAEISPFRGLLYDPSAVGDLGQVVCPPYDVISEPEREALEERSPYNIVRLVLPQPAPDNGSDKYTKARALLDAWEAAGVLRVDERPALYVYEQTALIHGHPHTQRGLLAAVSLEEPDAGGVLPHERVYGHIVEDRFALLRATATNLDTIFCVYEGIEDAAATAIDAECATEPALSFSTPDDAGDHRLWRIDDPVQIEVIVRALDKATVVIADGHHRWTTAKRYRDERRAVEGPGPWDQQLMLLVDAARKGPALLPIHRVLDGVDPDAAIGALRGAFDIEETPRDPEGIADTLRVRRATDGRIFALMDATRAWFITLRDEAAARAALPADRTEAYRDLDVSVLHALVFDQLLGGVQPRFVHSATDAAADIDAGRATLGVLLAPMPFDAVRAVAEAGDAMPQKSTYFVPKPKTGIVLRPLET